MKDKNSRLAVPVAVIVGCLALLLLAVALTSFTGAGDTNPAVGFPIALVVLAVVAVVGAIAWRAISRRKSSDHR